MQPYHTCDPCQQFPPSKPQCRCRHNRKPNFYAQFGVQANPPSGSDLPFLTIFQKGNQIRLDSNTDIVLPAGYLYLIDYLFLATPEPNGYFQITPRINGSLQGLYSFFAPANMRERNSSASGSFTTIAASQEDAILSFYLTYPETVRNIDITGAVSVTPLMRI